MSHEGRPSDETAEGVPAIKARIAKVATKALRGDVDPMEGCRTLIALCRALGVPETDALLTLIAIESELDDMPHPDRRHLWAPEALAHKDAERTRYLEKVDTNLKNAFQAIARVFEPNSSSGEEKVSGAGSSPTSES